MHRKVFLALVVVAGMCATAYAAPVITMGFHVLLPDKAGQLITIYVSGDNGVPAVDLATQVNDGITGPLITNVDLYLDSSLILFPNNSGTQGESVTLPERFSYSGMTTNTGTVVAGDGAGGPKALAIITISTVGLFAGDGPWDFYGEIPDVAPSDLGASFNPAAYTLGQLSIVPEPSSVVLGVFAAAGLCAVAIRRRRSKSA